MNSRPGDSSQDNGDYALDRKGNPIVDRYGRPVRRRSSLPKPAENAGSDRSASPLPPLSDNRGGARLSDRLSSSPSDSPRSGSAQPSSSRHDATSDRPAPPQYRRASGGSYGATAGAAGAGAAGAAGAAGYGNRGYNDRGYGDRGLNDRGYNDRAYHNEDFGQPDQSRYQHSHDGYGDYSQREYSREIPSRRDERLSRFGRNEGREGWRRPKERKAKPPRRRRKLGIGKSIGLVLLLILALIVGAGVWVDTSLNRTEALAKYDGRPGNTKGTNWLLVGSDSRAGLDQADADRLMAGELDDTLGRTDTIMVVHIPSFGGKPKIVSFPRDSLVDIPGYGQNKINQAFTLGGPQLLQQTIEQATGMRIDHYAEIGFGGFANLVDAVGGINMCVPEALNDPMAGINVQAGCQDMDGPTALGYVRSRYTSAGGDLDRVQRQRDFVSALGKEIASPGTLLNPFRFFPVIGGLTDSLTVNEKDHVWHLARLAIAIAGGADQETVPVGGYQDLDVGNVVIWDEQGAQQLFDSMK